MTNQFLRVGGQPPRRQAITLAAKVKALLDGRFHVAFKDVKDVTVPAMRHRVIMNFEGEAEGITTDKVLEKIIAETPTTIEAELAAGRSDCPGVLPWVMQPPAYWDRRIFRLLFPTLAGLPVDAEIKSYRQRRGF